MDWRYIWGTQFYWLCDMKTTYKNLFYTGPIHTLRFWYQEMLAYDISYIHWSHKMMVNVDYLSRIHDQLVKQHVLMAESLSLANMQYHPYVYTLHTLKTLFDCGKSTMKMSWYRGIVIDTNTLRVLYQQLGIGNLKILGLIILKKGIKTCARCNRISS